MGYIRNIWCLILLFVSSFALGQSIDDLTTQYHSLSGRYSLKSVSQLTDSTYLVTGQFIDYRPITNPFTVDSISTGMYVWSNNCEKWLIDSIGAKSGTTIQLKIKGSTLNSPPNLNHGAILDYQYGWPPIPVGIAAHLETCIWDDFMYLLNDDIDNIVAGVSTVDSTTTSNDSIFLWSKGTPYFTGITPDAIPDAIDSTFTRNDSIIIASNGQEYYGGPATSGGGLSTQEGATAPYGLVTPAGRGAIYVDTILSDTYTANGLTNNSWEKVGKYVVVDSIDQILDGFFLEGALIKVRGTNGTLPCEYLVQSSYSDPVDSLNVIPVSGGFAVIRPVGGKINVGWYTVPGDTLDNYWTFRKVGAYLQYDNGANTLYVPASADTFDLNYAFKPGFQNQILVYGNMEGAGRDKSFITASYIDTMPSSSGVDAMIRIRKDNITVSGLNFTMYGDVNYNVGFRSVTAVVLEAKSCTVKDNHFSALTVGSGNTAGNHYLQQFTAQNGFAATTTLVDTVFPGETVTARLTDVQWFTRHAPVILFDATTGNSDTTYVVERYIPGDSLILGRITDTIPAGAEIKTPDFGKSRTRVLNNIFENAQQATAMGINSSEVVIRGNIFRNNGRSNTQHDMYNQCGLQIITNNWFEGGSGYALNDANKQNYRISGGRIIANNHFFNKPLCIQLATTSNVVTWYLGDDPVAYYGSRVLNGGDVITGNVFHNTPGMPGSSAFQLGGAFGGIDPNSPLKGNATLIYSNNTHTGRFQIGLPVSNDYIDVIFGGNIFTLDDTSSVFNPIITLSDSTKVYDTRITSRGPDHYIFKGNKLNVDGLSFKQSEVTTLNEKNIELTDSWVRNSEFVIMDSIYNAAQTQSIQFLSIDGGRWENNQFRYDSPDTKNIVFIGNVSDMPTMVGNEFINTGAVIHDNGKHDQNFKVGSYIRNNPGMKIWSRGQYHYPFAGSPQTENSGSVIFAEAHTLTSTDPQGGDLIVVNADSTYTIATHTDDITGVLMMGARLDSIYAYSQLFEGQILRVNSSNAVTEGDYMVVDTVTAGKLKSQGLARPTGNYNILAQAMEDSPDWDFGTTYAVGDIVHYQNRNYKCTYPHTNQTPQTSQFTFDPYWDGWPVKVQVIRVDQIETQVATAVESNPRVEVKPSKGAIIGNSTIDDYTIYRGVYTYLINEADSIRGDTVVNLAVTGHNIVQQQGVWESDPDKATYDWVFVQVGLNDLNPSGQGTADVIERYQTLIDTINAQKKTGAVVLAGTMIPIYAGLGISYPTAQDSAQAMWQGLNDAILDGTITGIDYTCSTHTFLLGRPSDRRYLADEYDSGDGVHEIDAGRELIAEEWRRTLNEAGFLKVNSELSDAPYEYTVSNPGDFLLGSAVYFGDSLILAKSDSASHFPQGYVVDKTTNVITVRGAGNYSIPSHPYTPDNLYFLQDNGVLSTVPDDDYVIPVLRALDSTQVSFFPPNTYYTAINQGGTEVLDTSAANFFEATGITEDTIQGAITELVKSLKDNALWDKIDFLYPFAGASADAHAYNLIDTSTYKITWGGTVTHGTFGILPAINGYGDTGYNPNTVLGASPGSATIGSYLYNPSSSLGGVVGVANAAYNNAFLMFTNAGNVGAGIQTGGSTNPAVVGTKSSGSWIASRTSNTLLRIFDDGVQAGEITNDVSSNTIASLNVYIGATNLAGVASGVADTLSFAFVANTGLSNAEVETMHNIIEQYQRRLDRSAIGGSNLKSPTLSFNTLGKEQVVRVENEVFHFKDTSLYMFNEDYTLSVSQVEEFDLISITSRVNSSSTSDNTITLPDPADSLVNTRVVVVSDDLDNSFTDSYDTEVAAANIYKGNQNIPTSYVLAGGESIELICVPRSTGYIWELVSTWDGWTSTSSFSNTSQTILTERKTFLIFNQTGGSNARDTLDVSDLEPGDMFRIEIRDAAFGRTKALYATSGQFIWNSATTDSLYFNYGNQALDVTWNGVNLYVFGNKQPNETGWGNYQDTTFTAASPLILAANDTITLPLIPDLVDESQLPYDLQTFYDSAVDTVIVGMNGDSYSVTFEYTLAQNSISKTKFTWWIDIGGGIPNLYPTTFTANDGNNSIHPNNKSTTYYTLNTWEANGGKIKITTDNSIDLYDMRLVFHRLHKGR